MLPLTRSRAWFLPAAVLAACAAGRTPAETMPSSASEDPPAASSTSGPPAPSGSPSATPAAEAPEGADSASTPNPNPTTPPPLPKGTTILHIGDSFAGALGLDLNRQLKAQGIKGVLKYETASYIPTWASHKDLDEYLAQYRPDLVVITLGANELDVPDPEMRGDAIRRLVRRLGDRPCVWIEPPLWEGARDVLLPVIERNASPCLYMKSAEIAAGMPRARDKIHPAMSARPGWARYVVSWLARHRVPDGERPWELHATEPGER
jgi:hypothetical protein